MRSLDKNSILFSIAVLLSLMLFCVALMAIQYWSVVSGYKVSEDRKRHFHSARLAAHTSIEESSYLQANYPAFQQLIQKYPGSDAQRKVQWIKVLETAKSQIGISGMSFDVYPYQPSFSDQFSGQEDLKVQAGFEQIVVRLSLLHDGKLAKLLSYLEEHAPNTFIVSSLEIELTDKANAGSLANSQQVRLKAELTIKWYLIDVPGEDNAIAS